MKEIRNILCFSTKAFKEAIKNLDSFQSVACISMGSDHWYPEKCSNVFNLDIEDSSPANDIYNKALDLFLKGKIKESNELFGKSLNYEQAFELDKWIDYQIKYCHTFYIHCDAGLSRSQGVVRYIRDTYGNIFSIRTNPNNPCLTPNAHVVMMLKRYWMYLYKLKWEDV